MPMGSRKSRLLIVQRQKKVVTPVAYRRACSVSAGHVRTYGEVSGMTSTLLSFAARSAVLDLKGGGATVVRRSQAKWRKVRHCS